MKAGMSLLLSMGAVQRHSGRTSLLLAEVREFYTLPIEEACIRLPKEAEPATCPCDGSAAQ